MAQVRTAQKRITPGFVALANGSIVPLPQIDVNQRYTIDEASAYLRQSREKTYRDIRDGKIKAISDGRKYITGKELIRCATST